MRSIGLVAWFELARAVRTWRAQATLLLFGVASAGAAYLFTRAIGSMENALARQLMVAETEVPGAMLDQLVTSETYREVLANLTGSEHLVDWLVSVPPLAMFHLWVAFLLLPFFAASSSAESISMDLGSRAIRYEALRVGRLELVLGRFAGQLLLTLVASGLGVVLVWLVGQLFMVGTPPLTLLWWLATLSVRGWLFSIPFVGVGLAASQWTSSGAWARVMAISVAAGSWVLYGFAGWMSAEGAGVWAIFGDAALQLLPQGWLSNLWGPGSSWVVGGVVCAGLGVAALSAGYARFHGRDL